MTATLARPGAYLLAGLLPPAALEAAAAVDYADYCLVAGRRVEAHDAAGRDPLWHIAAALGHPECPAIPQPEEWAALVARDLAAAAALYLSARAFGRAWDAGRVADLRAAFGLPPAC